MEFKILLILGLVSFVACRKCQNGSFTELDNQMSVVPLSIQTCNNANYCFTRYYNDGQDIRYEFGCDEDLVCQAGGCTVNGMVRTCCCNTGNNCVPNGASDPVEFSFPEDFKFAIATSAYQIEGGYNAGDKGPSNWDVFSHKPNKVKYNQTGDVSCDSYHQYRRDVEMLQELGVQQYRFSISWSRIFPDGTNATVNQDGVDYYNNLINALLAANIEPLVTLFHWDLPQYLQDLGGFLNPFIADRFADYADFIFAQYGDRVKKWITLNEPLSVVTYDYCGTRTVHAPGEFAAHCEYTMYLAAHNLLRSHMKAVEVYRAKYQGPQNGIIGITLSGAFYYPKDPTNPDDVAAGRRSFQFAFGWFAHPIFVGDYPQVVKDTIRDHSINYMMRNRSRLPEFTPEELNSLKGSADFLGVNYYMAFVSRALTPAEKQVLLISDFQRNTDWGLVNSYKEPWRLVNASNPWIAYTPDGLREALKQLHLDYNATMMVTENGCMDSISDIGLHDNERIKYYRGHLTAVSRAINEDGARVIGYNAWSLMDNFEWKDGYETKFGLYHVDFNDPQRTRTQKDSAKFYAKVVSERKVVGFSSNQAY